MRRKRVRGASGSRAATAGDPSTAPRESRCKSGRRSPRNPTLPRVALGVAPARRFGIFRARAGSSRWLRDEKGERAVAELDALDVEFLAEEHRRSEHDEQHEREVEHVGLEPERLPDVANDREDRERDGENLVEKKDEPERARPVHEEARERFGALAFLPAGNVLRDEAESHEAMKVRNREREQPKEAELRRELHGEEQSESPHPGEGNRVAPEEGFQPVGKRI